MKEDGIDRKGKANNPLAKRMSLRKEMLDTAGVDLPRRRQKEDVEALIRDTFLECVACEQGGLCRAWLNGSVRETDPPDFCANKERFVALRERLRRTRAS